MPEGGTAGQLGKQVTSLFAAERLLVPRFTPYRALTEDKPSYAQTIQQLSEDIFRNGLIVNDVCDALKEGRSSLIADRLRELVTSGIAIQIFTKEENEDVVKLRISGIGITLKPDINFNCCIIDRSDIWYGSVNILGYHSTEDNIITFHDADTAKDILEMLYR